MPSSAVDSVPSLVTIASTSFIAIGPSCSRAMVTLAAGASPLAVETL